VKRFVRRTLTGIAPIAAGLIAVASVVLFRTLATRSVQLSVGPIPQLLVGDGAIERLAGAIRIPTVSSADGSHSDLIALESLHRHLATSFPKAHATLTRELVGGHSLVFTWKGDDESAKPVLLMAHMDVVPDEPGTESSWTHGPFSGNIADGCVWGRGALDDKVGVMAILEAVEILLTGRGCR
jgi:carboxypeptidase PM20D1